MQPISHALLIALFFCIKSIFACFDPVFKNVEILTFVLFFVIVKYYCCILRMSELMLFNLFEFVHGAPMCSFANFKVAKISAITRHSTTKVVLWPLKSRQKGSYYRGQGQKLKNSAKLKDFQTTCRLARYKIDLFFWPLKV